ncbi:hypothetical protein ABKN59_000865 [Abortiporus biennis]
MFLSSSLQTVHGLSFIVEAASLSLLAVLGLLSYIVYSVLRFERGDSRHWAVSTHVHWYFLSLLVSEIIQAIGGIMNVRWIKEAAITEGAFCKTQGVMKQLGDVGVALAALAIAIHTFSVIVFQWRPRQSPKIAVTVISGIWLFMILIMAISLGTHKGNDYFGDTQYWCWITSDFPAQRIALEYFWMWMTSLLNIALYVPIALVLKGVIVVSGFRVSIVKRKDRVRLSEISGKDSNAYLATKMLCYPAIYTITVLPIAIVRWSAFYGHCTPWAATVISDIIFACSGLLNVLLFTITRPTLVPRRQNSSHNMGPISPLSHSFSLTIPTTPAGGLRRSGESLGVVDTERPTPSFDDGRKKVAIQDLLVEDSSASDSDRTSTSREPK